jgi:Protein of unknown function (DUF2510)
MASSGWYADPSGRHEKRFFSGLVWTDRVSDGEHHSSDPVGNAAPPSTPGPRYPTGYPSPYVVVAPQPGGNGFAVAALTLGIIGALIALTSPFGYFLGGLCGLLGLIFGLVGLRNVTSHGAGMGGLAVAGVILGSVALAVAFYNGVNYLRLTNAIHHALTSPAPASTGFTDADPTLNKVRITSCHREEEPGIWVATGTLVNPSTTAQSFRVSIEFHIPAGTAVGTGLTGPVAPGQTEPWYIRGLTASFRPSSCTAAVKARTTTP